jgi:3-phosphoshikimate 1-carboxyvinyltransferase
MAGPEPLADVRIEAGGLRPVVVGGHLVARAIDELPIWAVVATQAEGISELREAGELRVKEVDRIAAVAGELRKMGAAIRELDDGMVITGPARLRGAVVESRGDHRLAMALAVAGLAAEGTTVVRDASCLADSFPGFVGTMQSLGAAIGWQQE